MPYKNIEIENAGPVYQQERQVSHFYKGFSSVNKQNFGNKLFDSELIKQDIINHFKTKKGERVMNPNFGSIIWDLLMEPLTPETRELLNQDITEICTSDPRATPTQLDLTEYENGYILDVTLSISNTDKSVSMRLTFDQSVGLLVQ